MGKQPHLLGEYRDGLYRRRVKSTISSASTYADLETKDSGTIYVINQATTQIVHLPKVSSNHLGLVYEFAIKEQDAADDFRIACSKFDSSAAIQTAFSSAVDNHTTVSPNSTAFTAGRFTAVSTVVWMLEQMSLGPSGFGTTAADVIGGWSTA